MNRKDIVVSYNCLRAANMKNKPLNSYLVIMCKYLPIYNVNHNSTQKEKVKNRHECIKYVLNFLRNFSRSKYHKFDLYYLLIPEMTPDGGRGMHLNILLHIPTIPIAHSLQKRLYKMFNLNEEEWLNMYMKPFYLKGKKDFWKNEDSLFTEEFMKRQNPKFLDLEGTLSIASYMLKASDPDIVAIKDGEEITYRELAKLKFNRGSNEIKLIPSGDIGLKTMIYCSQNISVSRIKKENRYIEIDPIWRSRSWIKEFINSHNKIKNKLLKK